MSSFFHVLFSITALAFVATMFRPQLAAKFFQNPTRTRFAIPLVGCLVVTSVAYNFTKPPSDLKRSEVGGTAPQANAVGGNSARLTGPAQAPWVSQDVVLSICAMSNAYLGSMINSIAQNEKYDFVQYENQSIDSDKQGIPVQYRPLEHLLLNAYRTKVLSNPSYYVRAMNADPDSFLKHAMISCVATVTGTKK